MAKVTKTPLEYTVLIDTREQLPYEFKNSERGTIPLGDYSLKTYSGEISIERKSLADLFQTLGKGYSRFKNELIQAKDLDYFAILIEGTLDQIQNKKFLNSYRSSLQGYVVIKRLFSITVRYGIPIFFAANRKGGQMIVKQILEAYLRSKTANPLSKKRLREIGKLIHLEEKPTTSYLKRNLQPKMNQTLLRTYLLHFQNEGLIRLIKKSNKTSIEVLNGEKLFYLIEKEWGVKKK